MRKNFRSSFTVLSLLICAIVLGGCGSSKKEGQDDALTPQALADAAILGDENCLQCHNSGQDLTMVGSGDGRTIGTAWLNSLHHINVNGSVTVHCEDCHGGGQFHWGLGPLPNPVPQADVCLKCHGDTPPAGVTFKNYTGYLHTGHANRNGIPDSSFSQIPTPVSIGRHIEECSVCHNNNQRFVIDASGNLLKPDNLLTPQVSCASCHDAHEVGLPATAGTTTVAVPTFRKSQIAGEGVWNSPSIRIPAVSPTDPTAPAATPAVFNSTDLICAACHTKGLYKNSRTPTHQSDTHSQWSVSAHNDRVGVPWNEIDLGSYPLNLTLPGTTSPGTCAKCHNGISTIYFMNPNPATRRLSEPAVVWNQSTATCITCHDPHNNGAGHTLNVRTPAVMTNYTGAGLGVVFGNVFLDTQPLPVNPSNPNSSICIFCHQGRESGLSLFRDKLAAGRPLTGSNFKNNHYLGTAAVLWATNAYEFPSSSLATSGYTANFAHQQTNCTGCHMGNETDPVNLGGHTWRPNPASCTPCHSAITSSSNLSLEPGEGFLTTSRATADTTNYSGNPASVSIGSQIQDLQNYIIALLAANSVFYDDKPGSGSAYFYDAPISVANGVVNNHANANGFKAWTLPLYKAAFNLAIAIKANPTTEGSTTYVLNGAGVRVSDTSQTLFANKSAAVHNYKYIIQLLLDSYTLLYNSSTPDQIAAAQASINAGPTPLTLPTPAVLNLNRPAGTRQAVNYGAYPGSPGINPVVTYGGTYDPRQ